MMTYYTPRNLFQIWRIKSALRTTIMIRNYWRNSWRIWLNDDVLYLEISISDLENKICSENHYRGARGWLLKESEWILCLLSLPFKQFG